MMTDDAAIDFIWLELTNRCNFTCTHCYSGSGPTAGDDDCLTVRDYEAVLEKARARGCRSVQFIGGEPTLNKGLPALIEKARGFGYEQVEVFTNLFSISEALWQTFSEHKVELATSFYSASPEVFDAVTQRKGSFGRVLKNLQLAVERGLTVRVGIIVSEATKDTLDDTIALIQAHGVTHYSIDHVREFGRGAKDQPGEMENLCGQCAGNVLAVGPDGRVAPCIMSKQWSVGNLLDSTFDDIAGGVRLAETRSQIAAATEAKRSTPGDVQNNCQPYYNCNPNSQCNPCAPNGGHKCIPNHNCNPGMIEFAEGNAVAAG